ncbi:HalOD1 output domain-containing protein [Halopenitus sp. H-Gu1]|uniref:HalOD1 output domain-containing protein n=1 Tax=Halopenitus sp. H-Gu1 TaxID=3242697 RepID=UPI00359D7AA7
MPPEDLTIYRGCTPVVDAEYNIDSDRSPADVVIDAVAEAAEVDPLDLPPLYEFVDPDAINKLFRHNGAADTENLFGFQMTTWNVFIASNGKIRVCDATRPTNPEPVFEGTIA